MVTLTVIELLKMIQSMKNKGEPMNYWRRRKKNESEKKIRRRRRKRRRRGRKRKRRRSKKKRRRKKKNRRRRKRKKKENRKRNISIDSLDTDSSSSSETDTESNTDSSDSARVQKTILIREPTKVEPFDVYSGKKIEEFFSEYEKHCKQQFPDNKKVWCTNLKESMIGRMKTYYDTVTCVEDPKYEMVKKRIISHVHRIKAGIKYKKRDHFQKARMGKEEAIDEYAHRLETLAWKKFGDQDMDENKDLIKKFLDTIPEHYAEFFNLKRKEKLDWTNKRLTWTNILNILEDSSWEHGKVDEGYVRIRQGQTEFMTYKEALLATPTALNPPQNPSVMKAQQSSPQERDTTEVRQYTGQQGWNNQQNYATNNGQRYESWNNQNRQMNNNGPRYTQWNNQPNSTNLVCYGCNQGGHMLRDCPIKGHCFSCGQQGHLRWNCPNQPNRPRARCGNCGNNNHFAVSCPLPRNKCTVCGFMGHRSEICIMRGTAPAVNTQNNQNVSVNNRNVPNTNAVRAGTGNGQNVQSTNTVNPGSDSVRNVPGTSTTGAGSVNVPNITNTNTAGAGN